MKISAKQYALLLKEIEGEEIGSDETGARLKKLARIMVKNRDLKKLAAIERIYQQKRKSGERVLDVSVKSPVGLSEEEISGIKKGFSQKYDLGVEKIRINNIVDEKVIGGLVFLLEGEVIDDSLKNRILKITQALG